MLLALRMHLRIHSAVVPRREEFGRPSFTFMRKQSISKSNKSVWLLEKIVSDDAMEATVGTSQLKKRCSWITLNTDPVYVTFLNEEWGVPVRKDRKLFELLVQSGALAKLTRPTNLRKRQLFMYPSNCK